MSKPFFAYMLLCADDSYYLGHTDDLFKRVAEHQSGIGCAYTSKRCPVQLVWSQEFATREEAKAAETQIKGWSKAKKKALIGSDFDKVSILSKKRDWAGYRERHAESIMRKPEKPADRSHNPDSD